jgi:hypothetical protein
MRLARGRLRWDSTAASNNTRSSAAICAPKIQAVSAEQVTLIPNAPSAVKSGYQPTMTAGRLTWTQRTSLSLFSNLTHVASSAMRLGIAAALSLLVLASPAGAQVSAQYWTVGKVMRMIDGVHISVNRRILRIESESTLCSGEGASIRRRGIRRWHRFACTFTTFSKRGVDRDLEFRLRVTSASRFVVFDAHWVGTTR